MTAAIKAAENGHKLVTLGELLDLPLPHEDVTLPEMNDAVVRLTSIKGTEMPRLRTLLKQAAADPEDEELDMSASCELIAASWPGATVDGVRVLPGPVIRRLFTVALRLSGLAPMAMQIALDALKATPSAESGSA